MTFSLDVLPPLSLFPLLFLAFRLVADKRPEHPPECLNVAFVMNMGHFAVGFSNKSDLLAQLYSWFELSTCFSDYLLALLWHAAFSYSCLLGKGMLIHIFLSGIHVYPRLVSGIFPCEAAVIIENGFSTTRMEKFQWLFFDGVDAVNFFLSVRHPSIHLRYGSRFLRQRWASVQRILIISQLFLSPWYILLGISSSSMKSHQRMFWGQLEGDDTNGLERYYHPSVCPWHYCQQLFIPFRSKKGFIIDPIWIFTGLEMA